MLSVLGVDSNTIDRIKHRTSLYKDLKMPDGEFRFSGYLEPEEVRAIINTIPVVSRHGERDQLLVETLWQTGARVTEVLTLVPERLGMTSLVLRNLKQRKSLKDKNSKTIRNGFGKIIKIANPDAIKEIEVSESLCTQLKEYCNKNNIQIGEWIFSGNRRKDRQLARWYVWDMLTRTSEKARVFKFGKKHIKTGGRFKGAYPHLLRHSNAMYLLDETDNIDLVREHLGHASVVTTQGYARVKETKMKRAIKEIKW